MAPAAAPATTNESFANFKRKQDLREAVGLWSWSPVIFVFFIILYVIVIVLSSLYSTKTTYEASTTQRFAEHWSTETEYAEYTQNPVSSGHSNRPEVDPSLTYNFREGAYVSVRPGEDQGLKGGFNAHITRQKTPSAGKTRSWIGEPWLKVLFLYMYKIFRYQKGHLVPLANMISPADQKLTNELENNIVPIHKSVNTLNMSAVERSYRRLANKEGELVEYTGWLGELPLGGIEKFEEFTRAHYEKEETITEKIEQVKGYLEPSNGRISAPKYLYKLVLRKDTYEFARCAVISNDVEQATHDPTLPKGGPPPEGMEVAWEDATRGRTRWVNEEEFFKWCGEQFPDYMTPQNRIEKARKLVKSRSRSLG